MRAKRRKKQVASALIERERNLDPVDLASHPKMQAESAVAAEIIEWLEEGYRKPGQSARTMPASPRRAEGPRACNPPVAPALDVDGEGPGKEKEKEGANVAEGATDSSYMRAPDDDDADLRPMMFSTSNNENENLLLLIFTCGG
jgi:hypothetical protein